MNAWQQFILDTPNGIGGDGVQSVPRSQPVQRNAPKSFPVQLCIEPANNGYVLFVPNDIEGRERLITGLAGLEWVTNQDGLFHFPSDKLQKIIYLTSNFSLRWGIPAHYSTRVEN